MSKNKREFTTASLDNFSNKKRVGAMISSLSFCRKMDHIRGTFKMEIITTNKKIDNRSWLEHQFFLDFHEMLINTHEI